MRGLRHSAALLLASIAVAIAGSVEEDWEAVTRLDAGPQARPRSAADAQLSIIAHLAAQENALRQFLTHHGNDAKAFEASLRLARLFSLRGEIQGDARARTEAARILERLEKSATPEQRPQLDFARISQAMRGMTKATAVEREALLQRARNFQAKYPDDRRIAALFAEVATLFDLQLRTKQALLLDARNLAQEDDLKARIADDLRRVDAVGQIIALSGPGRDGRPVDVAEHRGKVVVVFFFAVWSGPSMEALDTLQKAVSAFATERVQVIGVSLDTKPEALAALLKEKAITWPVISDGLGWESPLIRGFGINALPSTWLLDRSGKLRSLNVLESPMDQIRQMLREP